MFDFNEFAKMRRKYSDILKTNIALNIIQHRCDLNNKVKIFILFILFDQKFFIERKIRTKVIKSKFIKSYRSQTMTNYCFGV